MTTVLDELGSFPERIAASRARLDDLKSQTAAELEVRNELIVQAVDLAKMKLRDVAKVAGVAPSQVMRVLARSS